MIPADQYLDALAENRLLVFMECHEDDCQSEEKSEGHHFHQVLLNGVQFKKVSDAIILSERKDEDLRDGFTEVQIEISERSLPAKHFEGMSSIDYPQVER